MENLQQSKATFFLQQSEATPLLSTAAGRRHWLLPSGCLDSSPVYRLRHLHKFTSLICTNTFWLGQKTIIGDNYILYPASWGVFPLRLPHLLELDVFGDWGFPREKCTFSFSLEKYFFVFISFTFCSLLCLLAPTGALVLMMVYYIYIYLSIYPATFSDFEHLCLSILLQVSL